jgi:hypothetical protein
VRANFVVLGDIKETRISSALSRYLESFIEDCFAAKVFGKVFLESIAQRARRGGANRNLYTKLSGKDVFSALVV